MRERGEAACNKLGHDLLACAVLAGDEDVGIGWPNLRDQFQHRLHGRRAGHKLRHAFGAQQAILHFELAGAAQGLVQLGMHADQADQPLVLPRLLDKIAGAALDAFHSQVDVAPRRHHDHRQARVDFVDARQQVETFLP